MLLAPFPQGRNSLISSQKCFWTGSSACVFGREQEQRGGNQSYLGQLTLLLTASPCAPCSNFLSSEDDFCKWMGTVKACSSRSCATFNITARGVSSTCHHQGNGNVTITLSSHHQNMASEAAYVFSLVLTQGFFSPFQFASVWEIMRASVFHVPFIKEQRSSADSLN